MNIVVLVGPVRSRIVPVPPSSRAALEAAFTIPVKGAWFARRSRPGWDGSVRHFRADGSFLTGLLPRVAEILEEGGHRLRYQDDRAKPARRDLGPCRVTLRDYQAELVDDVIVLGSRVTLKASVGSGKTEISIVLAHRLGVRVLFITPGVDLAIQTRDRFARALPEARVGLVTGDALRGVTLDEGTAGADIIVANVAGLSAKTRVRVPARRRGTAPGPENVAPGGTTARGSGPGRRRATVLGPFTLAGLRFFNSFGLLVADECHGSSTADEAAALFDRCPAPFRIAMSATPESDDRNRDTRLVGHFGEIVGEITQPFLVSEGHTAPVTVRVLDYAKPDKLTTSSWPRQLAQGIVDCQARNAAIAEAVEREAGAGKRCLVIVTRYRHGWTLDGMIGRTCNFVTGANRQDRARMLGEFKSGRVPVMLATSVFDQGIDLKEIDRLFIAAGGASERLAVQRGGRLVRWSGSDKVLYDCRDVGLYDERVVPARKRFLEIHYRNRIVAYQGEGFTIAGV